MSRVFITGDTHSSHDIGKLTSRKFPEGKELTKNDYVVITGDFGLVWDNSSNDDYWQSWLNDKPWTTLWLDGNHENFDLIEKLPQKNLFGGEVGVVKESVFHLKRGYLYTIDDKTFFVMGGAKSIDKHLRRTGVSWWAQEEPNFNEFKRACNTLDDINYTCDYILTHEAPSYIRNKILGLHEGEESYSLVDFLDMIFEKLKFKHHYFGHFHVDEKISHKHTCVYNEVIELTKMVTSVIII